MNSCAYYGSFMYTKMFLKSVNSCLLLQFKSHLELSSILHETRVQHVVYSVCFS